MSEVSPDKVAAPEEWAAEQRRRYLLSQMGVTPMVSRFDVPGARIAERRVWQPAEQAPPQVAPATPEQPVKRSAPKIDVDVSAAKASAARESAAPAPATEKAAAPGVSFSLLICAAANYLWIEHLPERVLASAQLSLTTAMARAIGGHEAELIYRQFDWPIVDNKALPTDMATAQQSLSALLGRMRTEQNASGVIVMGECEVLPPLADAKIHRIPATLAMLETPALKAQAWSVLKPLVQSA